ncbi:MAG TPA: hypothetical protein VKE70_34025 [Candidatus Solibacter sp.]|nr:hypothetical protein [Candidatus Solibacter sp.]
MDPTIGGAQLEIVAAFAGDHTFHRGTSRYLDARRLLAAIARRRTHRVEVRE